MALAEVVGDKIASPISIIQKQFQVDNMAHFSYGWQNGISVRDLTK